MKKKWAKSFLEVSFTSLWKTLNIIIQFNILKVQEKSYWGQVRISEKDLIATTVFIETDTDIPHSDAWAETVRQEVQKSLSDSEKIQTYHKTAWQQLIKFQRYCQAQTI